MSNNSGLKHIFNIIGIFFVYAVFFVLLLAMKSKLGDIVIPNDDMIVDEWVVCFFGLALLLIGASILFTLLRYMIEQLFYKGKYNTQRIRWVLGLILHICLVIAVVIYSNLNYPVKEGGNTVILFYAILGITPYYLATALFSPACIKFAAPLSSLIRHW